MTHQPAPDETAADTPTGRAPGDGMAPWRRAARLLRALALPTILALGVLLALTRESAMHPAVYLAYLGLALPPCAVLAVLSVQATRSERARRAVRPVEAGIFVGLVVSLGVAILGGVAFVDSFSTGIVVALLVTVAYGIVQPFVDGRRRAVPMIAGFLVIAVALAGLGSAYVNGTFDDHDDAWFAVDPGVSQQQLLARVDERGVQLGAPGAVAHASPLGAGHVDAVPYEPAAGYLGTPADPAAVVAAPGTFPASDPSGQQPSSTVTGWATLRALRDGRLQLSLDRRIAGGVDAPVVVRLQRGSCSGDTERSSIETWTWPRGASGTDRRLLPLRVRDLDVGTRLSVVAGAREPLAPTRCADLASASGIALATLGAARFHGDCVAPLELSPADLDLLRPSSLQDAACAAQLERLNGVAGGAVVPTSEVPGVRRCLARSLEASARSTEHAVPGGVVFARSEGQLVDDPWGACAGRWYDGAPFDIGAYPSAEAAPPHAVPASAVVGDLDGEDPAAVAEKLR